VKVYICGAVEDILREFARKVERHGLEVVKMDSYSPGRSAFTPPQDVDAVIIGIDQTSHSATNGIVEICKQRGLPYAMGELRKWSLIYPRMIQAGILSGNTPAEDEEDDVAPSVKVASIDGFVNNEEEVKKTITEALHLLIEGLKGKARTAAISYDHGRVHAEVEYVATLKVDL
jgi:hypothetical protein